MDLNNLGAGKKFVDSVIKAGGLKKMGWSRQQQEEIRNKQPNSKKSNNER